MASPPIREILEIVRTAPDAFRGWLRLRALCAEKKPSQLWDRLEAIDPLGDVESARTWLRGQLGAAGELFPIRGIYLGLDLPSMDEGSGFNVEVGATGACDPNSVDIDWLERLEWYGEKHLIGGLLTMRRVYGQKRWSRLHDFADSTLVLGYSGLVLAEALEGVGQEEAFLAVWGYHDGDLFPLGRGDGRGFTRLAALWEPDDEEADDRPNDWAGLRIWQPPE
ncbi:MAG: hypothetical protein ACLQGP_27165 [Isosphaeraceae bacterium]